HNPDPLADTEVWQNSATTDTGPFSTLVLTIPAGATSGAGRAADVGLAAGDQRWFLLISSRAGYTDSAASAHGVAIYGG
ncbi:MAG: hypothetical protein JWL71_3682, partial [Acidobacteria bacterium]|nr:hypothetical protein [Acidobacteriota bacterium]